jgi:hypothetical protein
MVTMNELALGKEASVNAVWVMHRHSTTSYQRVLPDGRRVTVKPPYHVTVYVNVTCRGTLRNPKMVCRNTVSSCVCKPRLAQRPTAFGVPRLT